jgi:hypothetical protein
VLYNDEKSTLSRRAFVGRLAAGAAVAVAAAGAGRAQAKSGPGDLARAGEIGAEIEPRTAASAEPLGTEQGSLPAPWELLHPLGLGSVVAHGWRIGGLSEAVDGSCVLTLENQRGRRHRVHICRNDGRPQGLVYTERFDLVVMNGGQGDLPTEEGFAQSVAEVAHVLAMNESRQESVAAALMPHAERVERFAAAAKLR